MMWSHDRGTKADGFLDYGLGSAFLSRAVQSGIVNIDNNKMLIIYHQGGEGGVQGWAG